MVQDPRLSRLPHKFKYHLEQATVMMAKEAQMSHGFDLGPWGSIGQQHRTSSMFGTHKKAQNFRVGLEIFEEARRGRRLSVGPFM